jgi:hypothetical protein
VVDATVTVVLVEVRNDLGISTCRESMPGPCKGLSELAVVVDLSVEYHDHGTVLIEYRLVPGFEIYDCKALNAQTDAVFYERAPGIRAAMLEDLTHALDQEGVDRTFKRYLARDSTQRRLHSPGSPAP